MLRRNEHTYKNVKLFIVKIKQNIYFFNSRNQIKFKTDGIVQNIEQRIICQTSNFLYCCHGKSKVEK